MRERKSEYRCRACVAAGRDSARDERRWRVGRCDLCRVITRLYPPRECYPAKDPDHDARG